jgi:hypothetical protein
MLKRQKEESQQQVTINTKRLQMNYNKKITEIQNEMARKFDDAKQIWNQEKEELKAQISEKQDRIDLSEVAVEFVGKRPIDEYIKLYRYSLAEIEKIRKQNEEKNEKGDGGDEGGFDSDNAPRPY